MQRFSRMIAFVAVSGLSCGLASAAFAASGWQKTGGFSFTAGETSQFIHMDCPTGEIAIMGAFEFNSIGQSDEVSLGYNGPRFDTTPANVHEWGWHFFWPNGAMSGETATFDVYCVVTNPP